MIAPREYSLGFDLYTVECHLRAALSMLTEHPDYGSRNEERGEILVHLGQILINAAGRLNVLSSRVGALEDEVDGGSMANATPIKTSEPAGQLFAHQIMKPLYDVYVVARGLSALVREESSGESIILATILATQILELHNRIDAQSVGMSGVSHD